jgi:hypothetical protein
LQNPYLRPTLTHSAGYPNPLRVVFLTTEVGAGFLLWTSLIHLIHLYHGDKSPQFFCSSISVNCGSEQMLHIDQQNSSQSTNRAINKRFRVASDPQHDTLFKPDTFQSLASDSPTFHFRFCLYHQR